MVEFGFSVVFFVIFLTVRLWRRFGYFECGVVSIFWEFVSNVGFRFFLRFVKLEFVFELYL